ncbi:MAG: DHH family phosphoesterase [Muribaculaceae bacterium]|nr:DHH family phosphoesterase [Muribaculaceae bacterium]
MNKILNTTMTDRFRAWIDESERIVLTCHVRPDGDAIGSTLGLLHLLQTLGKRATVVVPDQPPRSLSFLPGFKEISIYTRHEDYCRRVIGEADLIVCCDFNQPSRQDALAPLVTGAACRKVMVDHHQEPDSFCDLTFSFPDMSSTCELLFRIIAAMGYYLEMDWKSATCICTGMVTDTRNFSVNCKNPDIYEVLMKLLEKGVDKNRIVREALLAQSLSSLRLQAYALSEKLEIMETVRAAIITLTSEELKRFNYERGDSEGLVNQPLNVRGVISSFFLRQDEDCIKVSARSVEDFPVSEVCKNLFGGGGHLQAAGAEFHGSLEECRRILVEALPAYRKYLPEHLDKLE